MIAAIFNCSQANFIVVVQTGINSFHQFLPNFTGFSPVYSREWSDLLQAKLDTAAALPDEDTLRSTSESKRRDLIKAHRLTCKAWQSLKRYIAKVFESDLVVLKLKAAGSNYYARAYADGWPEAQQMFINAQNFIEINREQLLTVMPADFQESFNSLTKDFKAKLADYEQSKEAISEGTQTRVKALNEIHRTFMEMMLDGQAIFEDDDAIRKQFIFTEILGKVSGPGLAGIRGVVTEVLKNTLITNATITITDNTGKQIAATATDAEGKYLANTPSGVYMVSVAANGFIARNIEDFSVDIGTVSKLDVTLSPLEAEDAG